MKRKKIRIPEDKLGSFIKQNKSTENLAQYYRVSSRTITRKIKDYGLKGIRPKGRKPKKKRS